MHGERACRSFGAARDDDLGPCSLREHRLNEVWNPAPRVSRQSISKLIAPITIHRRSGIGGSHVKGRRAVNRVLLRGELSKDGMHGVD